MPYVITTKTAPTTGAMECCRSTIGAGKCGHMLEQSRVAVATLDDIRRFIIEKHEEQGVWIGGDALHGPVDRLASGSVTVGPLPDGTIIEVTHARWDDIRDGVVGPFITEPGDNGRSLLAAFNAS